MSNEDRKFKERGEREGDRGGKVPEVLAHGAGMTDSAEQQNLLTGGEESAEQTENQETGAEGPETEGHMLTTHPYMLEKTAQGRQQDMLAEVNRARQADEAAGKGGGLRDRLRRRTSG